MQVNDFVKIVKQPNNNYTPYIKDLKGYIEEVYNNLDGEPHAIFVELKAGGRTGGTGSVPLNCLELLTGPELMQIKKWKQLYDDYLDGILKGSQNFNKHCLSLKNKALEKLAAYVGLTEAKALSAFSVFEEYQKDVDQARYEYEEGKRNWDDL